MKEKQKNREANKEKNRGIDKRLTRQKSSNERQRQRCWKVEGVGGTLPEFQM